MAAHRGRALPGLLGLGAAALLGQFAPDLGFNPLSGVVLATARPTFKLDWIHC